MSQALALSDLVNVEVTISPVAASYLNFGTMLLLGSSDVIDVQERVRQYSTIDQVAADFSNQSGEYLGALRFFSQSPRPATIFMGRWAQAATPGTLRGGPLTATEQLLATFTAITDGALHFTVDGVAHDLTAIDLHLCTNLNGVATAVQTKLNAQWAGATCVWDSEYDRFVVKSGTTGTNSKVSFATEVNGETPLAGKMGLLSTDGGRTVDGIAAETPTAAATACAAISSKWYGLAVATSTQPSDSALLELAAYIEASARNRILAITSDDPLCLDGTSSADIGSALKELGYKRTFPQYSSSDTYAAISAFGRAFTVNFEGQNTTLTLKFKQEPGVIAETLTETQAATLLAKHINAFVEYDNDTAILQEGVMSNGYFFDETHGLDWLQNAIQYDVFNLLYQNIKIPQTDAGTHRIVTTIESTLLRSVNNGLVAPGVWNGPPLGAINPGDMLTKGFYVYAPLVASQAQADREARKSVPIQVALKLAGAIHTVDVLVSVNR